MIEIHKLSKTYDKTQVLNNLDCTIKENTIYGLVGANGAGKTTTFRIIMGLLEADNGTVTLDDKKIDEKQIQYKKRPDVIKQIEIGTEAQNPTPGFSFKIPKENLSDGKHTIKINVVNSLGKVIESQKTNINYDTQIHIMYQAHVEKIGWQDWNGNGKTAGTTGECKRLEAIKIELENMPEYSVKYKLGHPETGAFFHAKRSEGEVIGQDKESQPGQSVSAMD